MITPGGTTIDYSNTTDPVSGGELLLNGRIDGDYYAPNPFQAFQVESTVFPTATVPNGLYRTFAFNYRAVVNPDPGATIYIYEGRRLTETLTIPQLGDNQVSAMFSYTYACSPALI